MGLKIRKATKADKFAIRAHHKRTFKESPLSACTEDLIPLKEYTKKHTEHLNSSSSCFVIAVDENGNTKIGALASAVWDRDSDSIFISITVEKAFQRRSGFKLDGKPVSEHLMTNIFDWLKKQPRRKDIWACIHAENKPAISFFEKYKFKTLDAECPYARYCRTAEPEKCKKWSLEANVAN